MIVDGFDYGDGWTKATAPGPLVEWLSESREWKSRPGIHLQLFRGEKYRRPMTDAEKQAEKAKEEKVKGPSIIVDVFDSPHWPKTEMRLNEAARIAQLPEVMAEVERQRKARTVDRMDWFWYHGTIRRCAGVSTSGPQLTDNQGSTLCVSECHKITDPAFIAMLDAGAKP